MLHDYENLLKMKKAGIALEEILNKSKEVSTKLFFKVGGNLLLNVPQTNKTLYENRVLLHQAYPQEIGSIKSNFISYFANISWSISMIILFPPIIGLTFKYYIEIPRLYAWVAVPIEANDIEDNQQKEFDEFLEKQDSNFNNATIQLVFLLLTIVLNILYYRQILNGEPASNWIANGEILREILQTNSGFTPTGLFSAFVQMALIYWVFNLVWRSFVFSRGLLCLFNKKNIAICVDPLHQDGCCGLKRIGEVGIIFNVILFLLGIYLSLKVIDKIVVQELPLTNDIGNPFFLACYALLAPVLFFMYLYAPHKRMKDAKDNFINPLIETYRREIQRVTTNEPICTDSLDSLSKLDSQIKDLNKKIPVWPFNLRSIESFFGTVIVPILPVILPFIVSSISSFFK